jgi:hypothetical protein
VVLGLFSIALAVTACDVFYDLIIENHTNREVIARITSNYVEREYRLRPCSVQIHPTLSSRPGELIAVDVQDTTGSAIYSARVRPKGRRGEFPQVSVLVPPEGAEECPRSISGTYVLVVRNYSRRDAVIFLDDAELGLVEGLSTETFGPLPGTWTTTEELKIRDTDGNRLWSSMDGDYDLGEVPEFFLGISSW